MPMDITATLNKLNDERQHVQYTPPVSFNVLYHPRGDETTSYAAIVTKIEAPGRICLMVCKPNAPPEHKQGVLWHKNPLVERNPHDPQINRNGTWDYAEKPPRAHEQLHIKDIDRRQEAAEKDKQAFDDAEAAKAKRQQEEQDAKAGKKLVGAGT